MNELLEFAEDYLVSLVDIGFSINVNKLIVLSEIEISKPSDNTFGAFSHRFWFDYETIKEDFIPFVTFLNMKYDILNIGMDTKESFSTASPEFFNTDDVLNDRLQNLQISRIYIQVNKKPPSSLLSFQSINHNIDII